MQIEQTEIKFKQFEFKIRTMDTKYCIPQSFRSYVGTCVSVIQTSEIRRPHHVSGVCTDMKTISSTSDKKTLLKEHAYVSTKPKVTLFLPKSLY